ncbi:hypothetical protein LIER_27132 [Lithospermum erythrorhizon]|uniref:Uncharacterized protein n=1 Tax=Lithospermum erythrorhizon TaxID=34254 RepID=A0AAV3REL0_LITER
MTGEYSSNTWIIDSGAFHHFAGSIFCMTDTRSIAPCPIGLPDGHWHNTTIEGRDQRSRNLIGAGDLSVRFWGGCILAAVHVINQTPSGILGDKLPFEILLGTAPSTAHLRLLRVGILGAYASLIINFPKGTNFLLEVGVMSSCGILILKKSVASGTVDSGSNSPALLLDDEELEVTRLEAEWLSWLWGSRGAAPRFLLSNRKGGGGVVPVSAQSTDPVFPQSADVSPVVEQLCRGLRTKHPSVLLNDYVTHTIRVLSPSSPLTSSLTPRGSLYHLAHYVNFDIFSLRDLVFLAIVVTGAEPRNFSDSISDPGWCDAMGQEIAALDSNDTWVMEPLPPTKKALGSKRVYKIKYRSNGSVERLKARLVIL